MIPPILAQIGIPVLTSVLGEILKTIDSPVTRGAVKALGDVEAAIQQGEITKEQIIEANRHAEEMAKLEASQNAGQLAEINQTIRAEIASQDIYVRRMRPTFGYMMALTWGAQMLAIAYVIVFDTARSVIVLNAMGALSAIWAVGLSVLGIYVYKRSEEKKKNPDAPETIFWNVKK